MDRELAKLVKEGDVAGIGAHLDRLPKRPPVHDLLWCAYFADEACRKLLLDVATQKKIAPPKKKNAYKWNDAHAAAISGDPGAIAKAEKRGADFEALTPFGTALTLAIRLKHADFVRALLDKGVDTTAKVKMARIGGVRVFGGNMFMTDATPLGVALRVGDEATASAVLEHVDAQPEHLGDAVHGANETLVRRVLTDLGDAAPLDPKLFWRVRQPSIIPVLAEHGFDLGTLPTDTGGSWGGPIWSWWAYELRGGESPLDCFKALFATGVQGTAAGLGDVLGANIRGIASTEMIDLFLDNGADVSDEIEWETDGWDEENDCEMKVRGSLAERMMEERTLELVQYVHSNGAEIRPIRPDPQWRDADEKKAWLENLGLIKELDAKEFPFLDSPSVDEIGKFFGTPDGVYGLKLGMTRDEVADWTRPNSELSLQFGKGKLVSVYRQYYEPPDGAFQAMQESLTAAHGKPKKKGKTESWEVAGGQVTLREEWNDAGGFVTVSMSGDEPADYDDEYDDDYDDDYEDDY